VTGRNGAAGPVAGIVLAAGEGRRFGGPKALAVLDGRTLLARAVGTLRSAGCAPVLAVVGAGGEPVAAEAAAAGAVAVANPDWPTGMGSSLRAGLAAVPPECAAAVVTLVDQPNVAPEAVRRLVSALVSGAVAARATYAGRPGHPVLLSRAVFADVAAVAVGDAGARAWIRTHQGDVVDVACDGAGDAADVDTAEQLAALRPGGPPRG
jgi:nicotine blue oxidoreductase